MLPIVRNVPGAKDIRYAESVRGRALRRTHRGFAAVADEPLDILLVGDSMAAGHVATTPAKMWSRLLQDELRRRWQPAGVTGGVGYLPAHRTRTFSGSPALAGPFTWVNEPADLAVYGLGMRHKALVAGVSASVTVNATGFDIFWAGGPTTGSFTWSIDGGAATTVNTFKLTQSGGFVTQVRGLSSGSHDLLIEHASGGGVAFEGVMVYDGDEAAGIRVWEGGHSGWKASDFLDPLRSNLNTTDPRWLATVATINPSAILIALGANELGAKVPPATYRANLAELVAYLRAYTTPDADIVIVIEPQRHDHDNDTNPAIYPWAQYVNQVYALARGDGAVGVCDLSARFGTHAYAAGIDLLDANDKVHPSDLGHAVWANALAGYLEP